MSSSAVVEVVHSSLAMLPDSSDSEEDSETVNVRRRGGGTREGRALSRPSGVSRLSVATGRRRRSSLFLLNAGRRRSSVGGSQLQQQSQAHLNELYKKAIRMNAENRINAANSWSINLIEHIDKFLEYDPSDGSSPSQAEQRASSSSRREDDSGSKADGSSEGSDETRGRVNFTKASCTLDASIKIYSYRVDDVHLTSYKVLANLNRNDQQQGVASNKAGGPSDRGEGLSVGNESEDDGTDIGGDEEGGSTRRKTASNKHGSTLESNVANINMNKLDSAFDIDPLFHKMSKTFDEGGAKGLLLVNLGVGSHCNIVFDSSSVDEPLLVVGQDSESSVTPLDLSSLAAKVDDELFDRQLVPQLASLRAQRDSLYQEGFDDTDDGGLNAASTGRRRRSDSSPPSRRYAAKADEEKLADVSIHQEAVERSHRLSLGRSILMSDPDDESCGMTLSSPQPLAPPLSLAASSSGSPLEYAPDDFGGGDDDFNDDCGGGALVFGDDDLDMGEHYSGASFSGGAYPMNHLEVVTSSSEHLPSTSAFLDKMASSNLWMAASDYEYLNHRMMADNAWAGTTFWKHKQAKRRQYTKATTESAATKKPSHQKKKSAPGTLQKLLAMEAPPDLSDILVKPKPGLLQWSRAVLAKHTKDDHLLPLDAGMGVDQLTELFLRPDVTLHQRLETATNPTTHKTVGFDVTQTRGDDGSYGGADDGPGYQFGGAEDGSLDGRGFGDDDDDYSNSGLDPTRIELDGVRKVAKVQVGYATVAKKVDVKRLKRDIWNELQERFQPVQPDDEDGNKEGEIEQGVKSSGMSFQEVVSDLESDKSQADASLPFYFICILHLANEKGLRLESQGLENFQIYQDELTTGPSF